MCEPRRVEVTATREVREAWEREIVRVAEIVDTVSAEARIVQPLDASVGGSVLMVLQTALARGFPGWTPVENGFRHEVAGGHVVYDPSARTLEIVDTLSEELRSQAAARETVTSVVERSITGRGESRYYHDGYGGHTEQRAREAAQRASERSIDDAVRRRVAEEAAAAEQARDRDVAARAEAEARSAWQAAAETRRTELSRRAAEDLREVGARARLAFHRVLAHAYREALLAFARRRGVAPETILQREIDDHLELEFLLPD